MRRGGLQVALAAGAALLAVACGGGSNSETTSSTAATSGGGGTSASASASTSTGTGGMLPAPDWSCVGKVQPFPKPMKGTATAKRVYKDFISQKPLAGLTVKLCAKSDLDCKAPLDTKMSGMDGTVTLTMPLGQNGFDGFEDVSGPGLAWLTFSAQPFIDDTSFDEGILSKSQLNLMATLVSAQYDATRGALAVATVDCAIAGGKQGNASGAVLEVMPSDAKTKLAYVLKGLPDKNATETGPSGFAGVLNLPPGAVTVTAKVKASGAQIGSYALFTRPDSCSSVYVPPMPGP